MLWLLLLLAIFPTLAYRYAQRHHPRHLFLISGAALGAVISPLSLGLYATYSIPYVGFVPGMLGLVSASFHGAPGFAMAQSIGVIPPDVVEGSSNFYLAAIDALIWAPLYGSAGRLIDHLRTRRSPESLGSNR
jgi:hypothetical protein